MAGVMDDHTTTVNLARLLERRLATRRRLRKQLAVVEHDIATARRFLRSMNTATLQPVTHGERGDLGLVDL